MDGTHRLRIAHGFAFQIRGKVCGEGAEVLKFWPERNAFRVHHDVQKSLHRRSRTQDVCMLMDN